MIIDTTNLDYSFIHRRYEKGDHVHPRMKQTVRTTDSDPCRTGADTECDGDAGGW